MEGIHAILSKEKRRLFFLSSLAIVIALLCLTLPPDKDVETFPVFEAQTEKTTGVPQFYSLGNENNIDFKVWDLKEIEQKQQKNLVVFTQPKKELKTKQIKPEVAKKVIEIPVQQIPITNVVTHNSLPTIKYLGQVVDSAGLQVFLSFDHTNIVMRPQVTYQNIWKVISVDDREVRLEYIPTKQIINVSKII